jgi:hypothetical protein
VELQRLTQQPGDGYEQQRLMQPGDGYEVTFQLRRNA